MAALLQFKHLRNRVAEVFLFYLVSVLLFETAATVLASRSIPNILLYNIGDIFTIMFTSYTISTFNFRYSSVISVVVLGILVALFSISDLNSFNELNYVVVFSTLGVCSGIKLLTLMNESDIIYRDPIFWIYSGMLIYCFSTINMYLLFDYLMIPDNHVLIYYYKFYTMFISLLAYSFYTKAYLCQKRNPIS